MHVLSDFDFDLPEALIAQVPLPHRTMSRLLDVSAHKCIDRVFSDVIEQLHPGDVLVFNDTRVLNARLWGKKSTGGQVEVLVERVLSNEANQYQVLAQVRASKPLKPGGLIRLSDAFDVEVLKRVEDFYILSFPSDIFALLDRYGQVPLPPYIQHTPQVIDAVRYQTVYAKVPGAVAAPTAGLHFDEALLAACRQKGVKLAFVTLHVGAGTFQPVRVADLSKHVMHSEWYHIPEETVALIKSAQLMGGSIIAVGTTSLRALESASQQGQFVAGSKETALFITPGYRFQTVTKLITNFHLPQSTLLMLVSAFAGYDVIKQAYQYAIRQQYRFFSYGDAMLLSRPINGQ